MLKRGLLKALVLLPALAAVPAPPAQADAARPRQWLIASPHHRLTAEIRFHGDDAPLQATIRRRGRIALSSSLRRLSIARKSSGSSAPLFM